MAKQLTEDELNLRRKARRRLIGAVALTLAVVVILPMVLESEPKPAGQDIELRIPAPDKVGDFVPGATASEVVEVSAASAPLAMSAPLPVSAPQVVLAPLTVSAPLDAVSGAGSAVAVSAGRMEAPGNDSVNNSSVSSDKSSDGESFVAQVGAYANPDTARQEAERLKKMGFKAYTEKIGDKTRVRVGPYAEREKAEKVRKLLEKHGLHPVVTSAK